MGLDEVRVKEWVRLAVVFQRKYPQIRSSRIEVFFVRDVLPVGGPIQVMLASPGGKQQFGFACATRILLVELIAIGRLVPVRGEDDAAAIRGLGRHPILRGVGR